MNKIKAQQKFDLPIRKRKLHKSQKNCNSSTQIAHLPNMHNLQTILQNAKL